jgi:hypothetical protein
MVGCVETTTACPVDLYSLGPARSSIILVLIVSLGVITATASATMSLAPRFPSGVALPAASVGISRRMADLDALEAQKTPLPVYSARKPLCRIVDVTGLMGFQVAEAVGGVSHIL